MRQWPEMEFVVGSAETLERMAQLPALPIFSDAAMDFLTTVSKRLLSSAKAKQYADVMTFAFWCRKASLRQMARSYANENGRIGRGVTFHIAPSNVALNFAYSMAAALLAGNGCVVRLPSKDFPQVDMICGTIRAVLADPGCTVHDYIVFVRYGHDKSANDALSAICDTRVIWGGDQTIGILRQSPLSPRANEITFADRYSIAVIGAQEYLAVEDKMQIAHDFFNDTYLTDQNACTAPRLIVWLGEKAEVLVAREKFWQELHSFAVSRYELSPVQAVDKLTTLCLLAAEYDAHAAEAKDNLVVHVEVEKLDAHIMDYRVGSGFFIECETENLADILPVCGIRCQTLSYYGVEREKIVEYLLEAKPRGVDRVVSIGHTMDFSLVWDGVDLITAMSRKID